MAKTIRNILYFTVFWRKQPSLVDYLHKKVFFCLFWHVKIFKNLLDVGSRWFLSLNFGTGNTLFREVNLISSWPMDKLQTLNSKKHFHSFTLENKRIISKLKKKITSFSFEIVNSCLATDVLYFWHLSCKAAISLL